MGWHFSPYALALFMCALATVWVAVYAWQQRASVGAGAALTLLGITIWSLGYAVAIGVHDLAWRIFWAKVQHLGIALTPVALAAFVLHYTGHEKLLTRRNLALLAAVPLVGVLLAWTNEAHGLIWADIELRIVGPLALLDLSYGLYFWFYFAYNYLILLASAVTFLGAALRSSHLRRRQATIMLIGTLCPGVALFIYLAGLSPLPGLDLAPLGFSLCGLVLAWGLFRYRLFDIVPIARSTVIENMVDGVMVLDTQGRIVDANPAMLQLIGRSAREVVGEPVAQILAGQLDLVEPYADEPESEAQITVGEGETQRYFDLRISPLYGRRKKLTGRVVVLRDTTEHRHAEAERERLISELDAFAHTVAHDLKNPLGLVIGYTEYLAEHTAGIDPTKRAQVLHNIHRLAHDAVNIIEELLLLAGVRKGKAELSPLDMADIVAQAMARLELSIEEYQIVLPKAWPVALGYAPWIEEVWVNYLSNGLRYGGRPPRLQLGATVRADGMIRFWVRDNGEGLAPAEQAKLFTEFTRISDARTGGHGLGLSIVKRIVEKLGGEAGVESAAGEGSLFYFTLPATPMKEIDKGS